MKKDKEYSLNKSIFKALIITIIILIFLLFGSNIAWFIYESQFETVVTEDTQTVEYVNTVRDIIQN